MTGFFVVVKIVETKLGGNDQRSKAFTYSRFVAFSPADKNPVKFEESWICLLSSNYTVSGKKCCS